MLIEGLQISDLRRGLFQTHADRPRILSQRAAQESHGEEAEQVQRHDVLGD